MKLAIIGSRNLQINNIEQYITDAVTEIVSGGAKGIDSCAAEFALSKGIAFKEFLPDYKSTEKLHLLYGTKKLSITPMQFLPFGTVNHEAQKT